MALHKSLCWKARWDSETTISPREICRYFFKDVAESLCEFVVLLPFHQVKEPHESVEVPELHSWSLYQEHQVDMVARAWSMLLHLEKRPDEARFAFGINIRHINILSTDMMISSRMLSFVLTLPQVRHITVGFAASDSNFRVTFGFFEKIDAVSSETSSRMHESEVNALNTMLTQLASEHGERLSLFLLHNGLHFIMENLIDQRLLAWSRIDFGSSAFNHLLENKCIARYSDELMMNALTQIFSVIGENSSLLSFDLIKLLLDNVKVANNASCSCDSVSSIILFIGKSIMDLLQFLLKNAKHPLSFGGKTQAPTEFSSSLPSSTLVSLNKNQKSFLSCKGLALLHQIISSPSFSVNGILTEDTPTYLICHNMILGLLITHDMCHRSKSLVVHCEHWMYHYVPDVKNGMLEFYAPIVIDELSRFLLGVAEFTPFGVDILCDCSCAQSINWNSESFISLLHLYIEMLETKAGSRWAQEKNMAGILSLLNILGSPYLKQLNEPLSVQTMVLGAVHTQGRKIKAPDEVVKFFEFIPPELLRLLRDNLASGFEVDVIQLIGKLLNFGIERNVHLKAVEVYATILVDISIMIVDAGEPCVIDIVPPLWSTNEPFEATLKSSRISKLISNEHLKNFDDSVSTSTLLMTFFSFLEPCVDKAINVLHYPVLVSLCALLYDKPIAHVCVKYNIVSKLLNLHESFTTLHISTIQQYCIWATCLICAQTIWDSSLCVHLSDHTVKRILQHSYSSLGMINRSRSSRLEVYVQRMNKTGNSNLNDHLSERTPNVLKDKNSHQGFKKVLLTLRAHLKSQLEIKASSDITDAFQESRQKSRYEDYLVEWVETLESITNERDDLTSTLYFILIDVISCMTYKQHESNVRQPYELNRKLAVYLVNISDIGPNRVKSI
ncbi:hypothetical protein AC1031_013299 [Aphanomyces cochlioides]|nr:hypothetical protein AC1031_013299 [Aphanomyces cochlioides]